MTVYCRTTPGSTRARSRPTRRKSAKPRVMPMLSMMTPRPTVMRGPLNHVNQSGRTRAATPAPSTHRGNAEVSRERTPVTGRFPGGYARPATTAWSSS